MKLRNLAIALAAGAAAGTLALGVYATYLWFTLDDNLREEQRIIRAYDQTVRLSNAIDYVVLLRRDPKILLAIEADARSLHETLKPINDTVAREAIANLDEIAHIANVIATTNPGTRSKAALATPMRVHQSALMTSMESLVTEKSQTLIDMLSRALLVFLVSALIFAGLCVAGFARVQRRLHRPLAILEETIGALTAGQLDTRIEVTSQDELGELAGHINHMAEQRQHDELELRRSEERFRQLTENINEVFWLSNQNNTELFYISPSYEDIWGRSRESLYENALAWLDPIHPDDRPRVQAAMQRQTEGNYHETYRIQRPDGEHRWISDRAFPVRDDTGKVYRIAGLAEDVTDRVVAYNALQNRMKELNCMYRVLQLTTDSEKTIEEVYSKIAGILPSSFQHDSDAVARVSIGQVTRESPEWQEPVSSLSAIVDVDAEAAGTVQVGYLSSHPDEPGGEGPFLAEERNLIEAVAAHIGQMLHKQRMTESLRGVERLEAIGQITGGVAHDFNNLLTVIMGNAELLREDLRDRPEMQETIDAILGAGQQGSELTHSLLAFSRRQPLEPRALDINEMIADMDSMLRPALGEHIDIELTRTDELWLALADPGQLKNALLNLAINGRDAMSSGGRLTIESANVVLSENYTAHYADVEPGEYVLVAVSDNGHGMTQKQLEQAFEPFYSTKGGAGTGLGLSMVYGFVKQLRGHVNIYSEVDHGTTVKMYLPRADTPPVIEGPVPEDTVSRGSETILVVEDDKMLRRYAVKQLARLGYNVIKASTGEEALVQLEQNSNVDLLFTDVIMPGDMTGRDLAEECQRRAPNIKVLYTSGYAEDSIMHHERVDPSVHFLTKPYGGQDLAVSIRKVLESSD